MTGFAAFLWTVLIVKLTVFAIVLIKELKNPLDMDQYEKDHPGYTRTRF